MKTIYKVGNKEFNSEEEAMKYEDSLSKPRIIKFYLHEESSRGEWEDENLEDLEGVSEKARDKMFNYLHEVEVVFKVEGDEVEANWKTL